MPSEYHFRREISIPKTAKKRLQLEQISRYIANREKLLHHCSADGAILSEKSAPNKAFREREERPMLSEIHRLNKCWSQAWLEKDAATVERLMADDYVYVAPSGMVLDRQAILAIVRSPSYRVDYATRTEVVVRAVGHEAAIVRHCSQAAGSFDGKSFTDDHRCVMFCEKQAGEWRIVMEQHSFRSFAARS
jgi:uncharacterized protein (TIGR02246 family)